MKRWTKLTLAVIAIFTLMACELEQLYLEAYIESNRGALDTPVGSDDTPVNVTIESGQSVAEIAGNLKARRLIDDTELFRRYLQYRKLDAGIQAGTYTLRQTMTIAEIAQALQNAQAPDLQVTIPEGKRVEEVAEIIADKTNVTTVDFLQLAQLGWRDTGLMQDYPFLAQIPVSATLEGFLFPDTYRFSPSATSEGVIRRMLDNFDARLTPEIINGFSQHDMSLYEGITLASIVEREAVVESERSLIAGVYYKRYRDGWFLSADPTVQYGLGYQPEEQTWWKGFLTFNDLDSTSPYNTYRNLGLPPGPIASPGIDAIAAAAAPAETNFYYFMVDCSKNDGSHVFAVTEEEHLINFNRCGGVDRSP